MLRRLKASYASKAREFSDSVARLGKTDCVGAQLLALLAMTKRQRCLCAEAEEALERYIVEGERGRSKAAGGR
jgi:hypothetical protein